MTSAQSRPLVQHPLRRGSEYINVWCFAEEADAQKFIARFGC